MNKPLVSIITPCYNGGKFVHRFLESVLNQTYTNIELIFVNDGSTDNTEQIVFSYKHKFQEKEIELIYIFQENKGQAAALNQGLKIFKGKYLTWPDSDDILHIDNIKNKVNYLERNQKFGMVLCKTRVINDTNLQQIGTLQRIPPIKKDNLFYDLIIANNVYFAPGGYMFRTSSFLDVNPSRHIYECATGQNWQMLLPVAYKYRCGYLDEFLYDYVIRANSHSRREISEEDILKKSFNHEDTLTTVVSEMKIADGKYYLEIIKKKYVRERLNIAHRFKNKKLLEEQYHILKVNSWLNKFDNLIYLRGKYPILDFIHKMFILPVRVSRKIKRMIK